jgi:hypothetical protein
LGPFENTADKSAFSQSGISKAKVGFAHCFEPQAWTIRFGHQLRASHTGAESQNDHRAARFPVEFHHFLEALSSPHKASELADVDDIFGWMIGSWEMKAVLYNAAGGEHRTKGELHASWVLEGRAVQDWFIFPRRIDRSNGSPGRDDRYGTTIKTFDRKLKAWRVYWTNPADDETSAELIARREGQGIMMEGKLRYGTRIRWRYFTITPTSFHYTVEKLEADGESWQLYLELFGKRVI